MSTQPKYSKGFHAFMIYFALWAYALLAVIDGGRYIYHATGNKPEFYVLILILGILLIILGLFIVKVRFDLAAFRAQTPKELLIICLTAAAIVLANQLLVYLSAEDNSRSSIFAAFIFVCWGIALYRYYNERAYLFNN